MKQTPQQKTCSIHRVVRKRLPRYLHECLLAISNNEGDDIQFALGYLSDSTASSYVSRLRRMGMAYTYRSDGTTEIWATESGRRYLLSNARMSGQHQPERTNEYMPKNDLTRQTWCASLDYGEAPPREPSAAPSGCAAGDGSLDPLDGMLVEGPLVWLARRDGICRGFPHRIEHRTTYYKINGKPYCPSCAEKAKQSIEGDLRQKEAGK